MRLDAPIEVSGSFWLPDEPDIRVPGDLSITTSGDVRLGLHFDAPSPGWSSVINAQWSSDNPEVDRILGITQGQGLITLDECQTTNLQISGLLSTKLTMAAAFGFTGCNYQAGEEVTFTEFTFSVDGIDEWLGVSGIDVQFDDEFMKTLISVRVPDEVSIDLPDGTILKFKFGMTFPSLTKTITEARVAQKGYFCLVSEGPRPLAYFTSLATKLRNFLRLAIGQPVSMNSGTGYSPEMTRADGSGGEYKLPISVYYADGGSSANKQEVPWFRMLFLYDDVKAEMQKMLANWLCKYEYIGPVLDVYFTGMSNPSQYLEVVFLQRVQGIENLHRRISSDTEMPKDEFDELLRPILLACPRSRIEWLRARLMHANELSLRNRLRAMIEPFNCLFGSKEQQEGFISKVVDTRNYLTHYSSNLEAKTSTGLELWELTMTLEVLFQLHLLRLIGFDLAGIDGILQKHSNLGRLSRRVGLNIPEAIAPVGDA